MGKAAIPQINQRLYLAPENYYIKKLEGAVNYNKGSCRKTIVSRQTDRQTQKILWSYNKIQISNIFHFMLKYA
jgi:hypothetical protein